MSTGEQLFVDSEEISTVTSYQVYNQRRLRQRRDQKNKVVYSSKGKFDKNHERLRFRPTLNFR